MALSKEALQLENDVLIQGCIRKSCEKINVNKDCISVWYMLNNINKTAIVTSTKQDYS